MDNPTWWWIAAAALIGAEMLTGTFYLLMLSLGMVAAAMVAYTGASQGVQIVVCALVSCTAAATWHVVRLRRKPARPDDESGNATQNRLDIGGAVTVKAWHADGTAHVHYRGAPWTALAEDPHAARLAGRHTVIAIRNNQLILRPAPLD